MLPASAYFLWMVAFLEGFSTLAVEVIAIRLAVPIVGSSMTLTGVMLGVVLLALSAGYWRGGALSAHWSREQTIRFLARNLLAAAVLYGAVAFPFEALLIERLLDWSFPLPAAIGAAAVALYLAPIYLASQTVPMLAELTNLDGHAGRASGRVLFFSTVGSVVGGIVTPVWLFPLLGVQRTTYVVCAVLAFGALAVWKSGFPAALIGALTIAAVARAVPSLQSLYSFDSAYQNIRVVENRLDSGRLERVMMVGGGRASGVWADSGETSFVYANKVIDLVNASGAESFLVLGSAGFNMPRDAARNPRIRVIDAVDVDPAVRPIAERYFLRAPLPERVRFLPLSARYAVSRMGREGRHYGFTMLDAYFGRSIPEELATVEFFAAVRRISARTAMNLIVDRDLETAFATRILASWREAFGEGNVWITDVLPGDSYFANLLVTSFPAPGAEEWKGTAVGGEIYRDDRNRAGRDFVAMRWD